jgi:imidazole glycerol-phosphate synthase subunit HisF
MLTTRLIACLDVRDGEVVKGTRFQSLVRSGDPARLAARYQEQGADELVMLDVSATNEGRAAALGTVASLRRELSIPLTVGGGVRAIADIERLLEAGADKVAINTAAMSRPDVIDEAAALFGRQCIVVAIDAKRDTSPAEHWRVVVRSGVGVTATDAVAWAREAARRGAGELLLTSWDRDGTGSGYDLALTRAVSAAVSVPVIASGGAAGPADMLAALQAGADAVLAAGVLHRGEWTIVDLKAALRTGGVEVRL